MKKRILTLALALVMCLGLAVPALAVEIVASGKCGDNLTWTLDSEGTLTISGTGEIRDFAGTELDHAPWLGETLEKISSVVIENGITRIGCFAFLFCSMLVRADIPATVTDIDGGAFLSNPLMTGFYVDPANNTYKSLDGVLYTADMTTLLRYPEKKNDSVYTIPEGVTTIAEGAFRENGSLTKVVIPDSVTEIGREAFHYCTALVSANLPRNITSIATDTFRSCYNLKNITIPDGVTEIGSLSFAGCGFTSVTIPASVMEIEGDPFRGCKNLEEIKVDPANTHYFSKDGVVYTTGKTENYPGIIQLISYPSGKKDTVFVAPEGTNSGGFVGCNNLIHITPSLRGPSLTVGARDCKNLKSYTIPTNITDIHATDYNEPLSLFPGCDNISDIYYPGTEAQWNAITKYPENVFNGLTIHFNSAGPDSQSVTSSATPSAPAFTDVSPSAYYAAPVAWAVEKEITSGTSATTFSPSQDCTNAQILTFLWRACGKPAPKIDNPFTNAIPDAYLQAAVWAYEQGMVSGSTFNANQPCTRAMAVTYIWQASGSPAAGGSGFTDIPAGAGYAQAVAWAVENGVTSGTSNTAFSPDNVCSRGQIVTFLYRAMAEK